MLNMCFKFLITAFGIWCHYFIFSAHGQQIQPGGEDRVLTDRDCVLGSGVWRTFYDKEAGKCVVPIGQPCHAVHNFPSQFKCGLANGVCNFEMSGVCECQEEFTVSADKTTCIAEVEYGQPCSGGTVCNRELGLACENGVCSCGESAIWNSTDRLCYSDQHCTKRYSQDTNIKEAFYHRASGRCLLKLGTSCVSNEQDCPPDSTCAEWWKSARCGCNIGWAAFKSRNKCIKLRHFGETCATSEMLEHDPESLEMCEASEHLSCSEKLICQCGEGWTPNNNGTCILADCTSRLDRWNRLWYDELTGQCKLLLSNGRHPRFYRAFNAEVLEENLISCPTNSSIRVHNANGEIGSCVCAEGLLTSADSRSCVIPLGYGESCKSGEEDYCDKAAGIACEHENLDGGFTCGCGAEGEWSPGENVCYSDEFCQKKFGHAYFYDRTHKTCKTLLYHPCSTNSTGTTIPTCSANAICVPHPLSYAPWVDERYNYNGICMCPSGHFESVDLQSCIDRRDKDACLKQDTSDDERGNWPLVNVNIYVWNPARKYCYRRQGLYCLREINEECTSFSTCRHTSPNYTDGNGAIPSVPIPKCQCMNGYEEGADGTCMNTKYGQTCGSSQGLEEYCLVGLRCMDGICVCNDLLNQVYDPEQKICAGIANSPCSTDDVCIINSECSANIGTCQCIDGFLPTRDRLACTKRLLGNGEPCLGTGCDNTKGLGCINGTCECASKAMMYDRDSAACLAGKGAICGKIEVGLCSTNEDNTRCMVYNVGCEAPAVCKPANEDGETMSVCTTASSLSRGFSDGTAPTLHVSA